jgi:hypothetical protein
VVTIVVIPHLMRNPVFFLSGFLLPVFNTGLHLDSRFRGNDKRAGMTKTNIIQFLDTLQLAARLFIL